MREVAEFAAVLACSLFTGAAVYISMLEHPARMECGVEIAATEFPPSYRRAAVMQVNMAALCLVCSIAAWFAGATFWWLIAGILVGLVIPFTLIVILPTNKQLLNPALNRKSPEVGRLLTRWGALHAVRTVQRLGTIVVPVPDDLHARIEAGTGTIYPHRCRLSGVSHVKELRQHRPFG